MQFSETENLVPPAGDVRVALSDRIHPNRLSWVLRRTTWNSNSYLLRWSDKWIKCYLSIILSFQTYVFFAGIAKNRATNCGKSQLWTCAVKPVKNLKPAKSQRKKQQNSPPKSPIPPADHRTWSWWFSPAPVQITSVNSSTFGFLWTRLNKNHRYERGLHECTYTIFNPPQTSNQRSL